MSNKKKGFLLPEDTSMRDMHIVKILGSKREIMGRCAGTLREVRQFVENELDLPPGSYQLVRYYDQFVVEEVTTTQVAWFDKGNEPDPDEGRTDADIEF